MKRLASLVSGHNLRRVTTGFKFLLSLLISLPGVLSFSLAFAGLVHAGASCNALGDWVLAPEELAGCGCEKLPAESAVPDNPPAGCAVKREFCVAAFAPVEQWALKPGKSGAEAVFADDDLRGGKVLEIRRTKTGTGRAGGKVLQLSSPVLGRDRFNTIKSVRLWVRGDGSDRYLRVFIKDRSGEAFTHTRRFYLDFNEWMPADLVFSPVERLLSHGGNRNGIMEPPLSVSHILVSGDGGDDEHVVAIDSLSVIGCLETGENAPGESVDEEISPLAVSKPGPASPGLLVSIGDDNNEYLLSPDASHQLKIDVGNASSSQVMVDIQLQVHRVFGDTKLHSGQIELPAGGQDVIRIPVDLSMPGWYRIQACARARNGSGNCNETGYLVWEPVGNTELDKPVTFPGFMESLDLFPDHLPADLSVMRQAGVMVLRFPFRWKDIEPRSGAYRWGAYDKIFAECERAGMIPQPIVVQTPEWARKPVTNEDARWSPAYRPPRDMSTFRRFMEVAARRYAKYAPYWEIWNEPHAPNFWVGGSAAEYVDLLRAGYSGVKAADQEALVLVGAMRALPGPRKEFMRHVLENGREFFDILTVHSHGPVQRLRAEVDATMGLWRETAGGNVQLWLNETGFSADPASPDGELIKAAELVKKMVVARMTGIRNFSWFNFRHLQAGTALPYDNYAALDREGRPRPVILAYNNANRWLRGTLPETAVEASDHRLEIYRFRKDGRLVQVVWARDPEIRVTLDGSFSGSPDRVRVFDMFGGAIPWVTGGAGLKLPQGGYPVFVVEDPVNPE